MKQGCSAGIKVKLSEDGQKLVIAEISEDHNHEVDKVGVYNIDSENIYFILYIGYL